jgi:hypothetical protein
VFRTWRSRAVLEVELDVECLVDERLDDVRRVLDGELFHRLVRLELIDVDHRVVLGGHVTHLTSQPQVDVPLADV